MPDRPGLDGWIEIFRGGRQVDATGREHDGDRLIEQALATFDPAQHEPPVVVGHPADNAPAFGWVAALKAETTDRGRVLLARLRQVVPEFADLVRRGVYKKRSAAFYPDGRLRHVGFLGAAPPAVKGLADIGFAAADGVVAFELNAPQGADHKEGKMTFKEFLEIFKFWKQVEADPDVRLPEPPPAAGKAFSEAELESRIEAAKREAAQAARREAEAEFAEKTRRSAADARRAELKAWYDRNLAAGKIPPAWGKMGLLEFMQALDAETEIQFAEGTKASAAEWMKRFIDELPKAVEFGEVARRDRELSGEAGAARRRALEAEFMEKHPGAGLREAMLAVSRSHPQLYAGE